MAGLMAALWLLGLYAAAPLLRAAGETASVAGRMRDALILGIAIPFSLAAIGLLFPVACWIVLAACVMLAYRRSLRGEPAQQRGLFAAPLVTIAALFAVAWPQLMRPLLDGDSLSYHLPNAAAWVHAHSLWTAATQYWWYPPGSELFASGLYSVAGPFALPWSGFCALALLGFRLAEWTRSDALAAAAITAYPLAIQGGTMQNDVWLAAFFVETLWLLRAPPQTAALRSVAITTLVKPQGWLFAAIALGASRAPLRAWGVAIAVAAAWLAHDLILVKHALLSPAASAAYPNPFATTILAHAPLALWLLVAVALRISPFALAALCAALAGPLLSARERATSWAAFAAAIVFFVLPFGYETNVAQLATGESLRFAAPAIAAGAVLLAPLAQRFRAIATPLLLASVAYGIWYLLAIFWNDGGTHVAPAVAIAAAAVTALTARMRAPWPAALAVGAAVVLATHLAARHPLDYYNDALSVRGTAPGVYRWIATAKPAELDGVGLRLGVVNVLSPSTNTRDLLDAEICSSARSGAALVAVAQSDIPAEANEARLRAARGCGRTLYSDALAVVTER